MAMLAEGVAEGAIGRGIAHRARGSGRMATRSGGTATGRSNRPRAGQPQPTVWVVMAVAAAIGLVALVTSGKVQEGTFLALLAFVVIGAIIPAVALPVGIVILIATFFRGDVGTKFFHWLGGLSKKASGPSSPSPSLDPTVYLPSKSIGAA